MDNLNNREKKLIKVCIFVFISYLYINCFLQKNLDKIVGTVNNINMCKNQLQSIECIKENKVVQSNLIIDFTESGITSNIKKVADSNRISINEMEFNVNHNKEKIKTIYVKLYGYGKYNDIVNFTGSINKEKLCRINDVIINKDTADRVKISITIIYYFICNDKEKII